LRQKLCRNVSSVCAEPTSTALGIGSFMVDTYSSHIRHDDHLYFCKTGSIHNYSYLPAEAECYNDMEPKLPPQVW
jgi:hypothetical protein